MRKIPEEQENFFDTWIIEYADIMSSTYKSLDMTPNMLTTVSLICNINSAILFFYDNRELAVLMFLIGYYFDCADGFYARKYNMETEFGDYYDHFNDMLKLIMIMSIMYYKSSSKFYKVLPIILGFGLLTGIHIGCQEKIYSESNNIKSGTLNIFKSWCLNTDYIYTTKYFGVGTLIIVFCIVMLMY